VKTASRIGLGILFTLALLSAAPHAHAYNPGDFICWGVQTISSNNGGPYAAQCQAFKNGAYKGNFGQAFVRPVGSSSDLNLFVTNVSNSSSGEHCNGVVECNGSFGSFNVTMREGNWWWSWQNVVPTSVGISCYCR
jgi:hypothetical protein